MTTATQVKHRRGTTAQHAAFTGADGEITVDQTTKSLVVHDGSTLGGTRQATEGYVATAVAAVGTGLAQNLLLWKMCR